MKKSLNSVRQGNEMQRFKDTKPIHLNSSGSDANLNYSNNQTKMTLHQDRIYEDFEADENIIYGGNTRPNANSFKKIDIQSQKNAYKTKPLNILDANDN